MDDLKTVDVPIAGMDCAECTQHVRRAIAALPGVVSVEVLLAAERATVQLDPAQVSLAAIVQAVTDAGYAVPAAAAPGADQAGGYAALWGARQPLTDLSRRVGVLLGLLFAVILFVVVFGEWLGLFERITARAPWPLGLAIVIAGGYPVFRKVARATLRGQIISHTLMTLGVIAALTVGEWATAAVVVFFMRVGDYVERFTGERARRAVRDLTALAPQTARIERDGREVELPIGETRIGEVVIVRPGERIPVDGEVVSGQATVDQAAITGEALPAEVGPGAHVYAASFARLGSLRVRATHIGADSTFGRVIRLVEEAEANRANVQLIADRFSTWYLPIVAAIAGLTFLLRRDPLATAAVLVVACSCSFALATPIAMLASIGAGARRGLLIKGGRHLETLARADVLLIDKTGTVTLGRPRVTEVLDVRLSAAAGAGASAMKISPQVPGTSEVPGTWEGSSDILYWAASAERYSEHPLAEAVRVAARERGLHLAEPEAFEALPGLGVRARVGGAAVAVGNRRLIETEAGPWKVGAEPPTAAANGEMRLYVAVNNELVGVIAAADALRPEAPAALARLRELGIRRIELLTGDNETTAQLLAGQLGIPYRANLLPEDKIRIVQEYQTQGHIVVMVGDGVNDAPALAQADVGLAMAAAGSDVAIEAAHVALLRDDWHLAPELFRIARRTLKIVRINLAFTAAYNIVGLTLAAFGILPPILAAAAQSLPDLGILGNSSRLLRHD
jgi:Cd2+/Zn2+-exporting ATPase/Cu+-exporting ATPase